MNTIEISKMMHLTPNFRGVVPCCEIEQFRKHDVFGLIVNTDPHDKPGQHWIAIYKDGGKLSFFDSFGRTMGEFPEPFASIMNDFAARLQVKSNRMQYQNILSDTCGQWSIYYILSRLYNVDFRGFSSDTYKNEQELNRQLTIVRKKLRKLKRLKM